MIDVEVYSGALYCDLTPEDLGCMLYTPHLHIPINYGTAMKAIGEEAVQIAKSTCPVDTGYLRSQIGTIGDDGGVEIWSDAYYSAYQEYGTSRMAAQPYFEAAIQNAADDNEIKLAGCEAQWLSADEDMNFLTAGGDYSLAKVQRTIDKMYSLSSEFYGMAAATEDPILASQYTSLGDQFLDAAQDVGDAYDEAEAIGLNAQLNQGGEEEEEEGGAAPEEGLDDNGGFVETGAGFLIDLILTIIVAFIMAFIQALIEEIMNDLFSSIGDLSSKGIIHVRQHTPGIPSGADFVYKMKD